MSLESPFVMYGHNMHFIYPRQDIWNIQYLQLHHNIIHVYCNELLCVKWTSCDEHIHEVPNCQHAGFADYRFTVRSVQLIYQACSIVSLLYILPSLHSRVLLSSFNTGLAGDEIQQGAPCCDLMRSNCSSVLGSKRNIWGQSISNLSLRQVRSVKLPRSQIYGAFSVKCIRSTQTQRSRWDKMNKKFFFGSWVEFFWKIKSHIKEA